MINRVLIRTKVVQMLFCYFLNRNEFHLITAPESTSRDKQYAYNMYLDLLLMVLRLSGYRTGVTSVTFQNKFLAENRIGKALKNDPAVKDAIYRRIQSASQFDAATDAIYRAILASAIYRSYTHRKDKNVAGDIEFWDVVIDSIIAKSPELLEAARKDENFSNVGYENALKMLRETLDSCGSYRKLLIEARHSLQTSLDKSYELYLRLLSLPVELVRLQDRRLDNAKNKFLATSEDLNPNMKFVDNKLTAILESNEEFNELCSEKKVSWSEDPDFLMTILDKIVGSELYAEYMSGESSTLKDDCEFWRQVMKHIILPSDELAEYLESKSVYWNDDSDIIGTFVVKTLKKAADACENNINASFVLPQFKDEEDSRFGEELFTDTIDNFDTYRGYVDKFINSSQWDPERLAFMDVIIMCTAISELLNYPAIPIPVTLNEYIEIANSYSTPRSGQFINGILYSVISHLQEEGKLLKK